MLFGLSPGWDFPRINEVSLHGIKALELAWLCATKTGGGFVLPCGYHSYPQVMMEQPDLLWKLSRQKTKNNVDRGGKGGEEGE